MSREEYRVIEAHLNLLRAIQDQAARDGFSDEFEEYWFYSPEMVTIWRSICEEVGVLIDGIDCECADPG